MNTSAKLIKTFFVACFIFISCDWKAQTSQTAEERVINTDSLRLLQKEIALSRSEIKSAFDSIDLYNLTRFNDTCIKYLYIIYHDSYIERENLQVPLSQCVIKPIRINRLNKATFRLTYDTFLYDSIPGQPQIDRLLDEYSIPLQIDFDTVLKKPINFYIGHYKYANAAAFHKWYGEKLTSESFKNYLKYNEKNFSSDFRRLTN